MRDFGVPVSEAERLIEDYAGLEDEEDGAGCD